MPFEDREDACLVVTLWRRGLIGDIGTFALTCHFNRGYCSPRRSVIACDYQASVADAHISNCPCRYAREIDSLKLQKGYYVTSALWRANQLVVRRRFRKAPRLNLLVLPHSISILSLPTIIRLNHLSARPSGGRPVLFPSCLQLRHHA